MSGEIFVIKKPKCPYCCKETYTPCERNEYGFCPSWQRFRDEEYGRKYD